MGPALPPLGRESEELSNNQLLIENVSLLPEILRKVRMKEETLYKK
jgi:hypothetical protein